MVILEEKRRMDYMKGSSAVDLKKRYRYKDYLTWPEEERWELIEGVPYDMSPAPRIVHQDILGRLFRIIADFLDDKPCKVMLSPVDVILHNHPAGTEEDDEEADTVVQPDLLVLCDPAKLTANYCRGAPDLLVEILSPSTAHKDMSAKFKLYEKHGVREYWIVNPDTEILMVHILEQGEYTKPVVFKGWEILRSRVLADLELDLGKVWPTGRSTP